MTFHCTRRSDSAISEAPKLRPHAGPANHDYGEILQPARLGHSRAMMLDGISISRLIQRAASSALPSACTGVGVRILATGLGGYAETPSPSSASPPGMVVSGKFEPL